MAVSVDVFMGLGGSSNASSSVLKLVMTTTGTAGAAAAAGGAATSSVGCVSLVRLSCDRSLYMAGSAELSFLERATSFWRSVRIRFV